MTFMTTINQTHSLALVGVAQWIVHWPANKKVAGSIPSQGMCLGCGQVPSWGHGRDNQPMFLSHTDISFSIPSPHSKNKFKKNFKGSAIPI